MFPSAPIRKYPDESAVNQTTVHASVGIVLPTPDKRGYRQLGSGKSPMTIRRLGKKIQPYTRGMEGTTWGEKESF
jgi:hypothetical protein